MTGLPHDEYATATEGAASRQTPTGVSDHEFRFRSWYWLAVPLLAIAAYATVLRIGFLSDDFALLSEARANGAGIDLLLPRPYSPFYRPVGLLITWIIGWQLWGFNPLPYHLLGLLVHAATSLVLGLWLAAATSQRGLGWLAGALFAAFPLHTEAVGWLAAQWDAWATFFGVASLWLFTKWWYSRSKNWLYLLSLFAYGAGLFSKESLISWLPMLALVAWLVTPRITKAVLLRLAYALLPYALVLALYLAVRILTWGSLGGYAGGNIYSWEILWSSLVGYCRALLSPLNSTVFGSEAVWIVGFATVMALVSGIIRFGRGQKRLLLVAGSWIFLALLPVLNLSIKADDLQQNRFLYLAAAGYSVGVAALLQAAIASIRKRRQLAFALCGLLLLVSTATCWIQLSPWHTASAQAQEVVDELARLIPPEKRDRGMVWYVESVPDNYKGAYVLRIGLGAARAFTDGDFADVRPVAHAPEVDVTGDRRSRDTFALQFDFDKASDSYHVAFASGMTSRSPLTWSNSYADPLVWDFRQCERQAVDAWRVMEANASCERGSGLVLSGTTEDPRIVSTGLQIRPTKSNTLFVRIRASVVYRQGEDKPAATGQWFWNEPEGDWSEERSRKSSVLFDGEPRVYWTFLHASEVGDVISGLRFDPANERVSCILQWISIDTVK